VDDDGTHLMILRGYVERRIQANEPIDAELAILLLNHANMHFQQLQQKNPDQAKQLEEPLQQMAQYLGQVVAKEQQAQQAAQAPVEGEAVPVEGGYE
jgi:HD-like signal output (HDOD) protein